MNEALYGFARRGQGPAVQDSLSERRSCHDQGLHHNAYRCRDSEETRRFYEDFLGLPLVNAFEIKETKSGRRDPHAALVLRAWTTARASRSSRRRTCRSSSSSSTTSTCTSRSRSAAPALDRCSRRASGPDRDARHLRSRLHRLDLLPRPQRLRDRADRKRESHERAMDPETNRARRTLEDWQKRRA